MRFGFISFCLWLILGSYTSYAQSLNSEALADFNAYCKYISEKNKAKSLALKAPDAVLRIANGDINNNFQRLAIAALSKDLSDLNKARYFDKLIKEECNYYRLNQEAKLQIEYAIIAAKQESLHYKLREIKTAKTHLQHLLRSLKSRVERHNDTLKSYYDLDMALKKLEDVERQIYVDLVSQQIPKLQRVHLQQLLRDLRDAQHARQKTMNGLQKNDNWSLQLQAGAQQNWPQNQSQNIQPYFALFVRYNLGTMFSNKQTNQSLDSFMNWQNQQVLGTQKQLIKLMQALNALKEAERDRMHHLSSNFSKYEHLSKSINNLNTLDAQHFKQQIDVDRILMGIEIKYVQHNLMQLERMLA